MFEETSSLSVLYNRRRHTSKYVHNCNSKLLLLVT